MASMYHLRHTVAKDDKEVGRRMERECEDELLAMGEFADVIDRILALSGGREALCRDVYEIAYEDTKYTTPVRSTRFATEESFLQAQYTKMLDVDEMSRLKAIRAEKEKKSKDADSKKRAAPEHDTPVAMPDRKRIKQQKDVDESGKKEEGRRLSSTSTKKSNEKAQGNQTASNSKPTKDTKSGTRRVSGPGVVASARRTSGGVEPSKRRVSSTSILASNRRISSTLAEKGSKVKDKGSDAKEKDKGTRVRKTEDQKVASKQKRTQARKGEGDSSAEEEIWSPEAKRAGKTESQPKTAIKGASSLFNKARFQAHLQKAAAETREETPSPNPGVD